MKEMAIIVNRQVLLAKIQLIAVTAVYVIGIGIALWMHFKSKR